jgi:two-component system sensor histidine kinase YesM
MSSSASNPFEFIMLNVIRLFMKDDYLKMQASEREYKMQILKMQVLQYQINPHFLHNTLNSIYWEAIRMTSSENPCSVMVSNLSTIIRYSLSSPKENVKISEEINYLKKYMDIMKIRYSNKFVVQFRIDPACIIYPIKKMILQPLVENSIYHGIKEKSGQGIICIGACLLKKSILMYVWDNGKGISSSKLSSLQKQLLSDEEIPLDHVGLISTNLRLKFAYGKDSILHIKSIKDKFTIICFRLPLPGAQDNEPSESL